MLRLVLVIGAVVVAVAVGGLKIANVFDSASDAVKEATGAAATAGGDEDSLIRTANFARALDVLRAKVGADAEVLDLRLEPATATWQVRDGDEAVGYKLLAGSSDLSSFGVDLIGPGKIQDNVFPLAKISPSVPERLVDAAKARNPTLTLDDVNFLTLELDPVTGKPEWNLNAGGGLYVADLDGSDLRQPGDEGRRVADCIAAAKGDPAKIQACALQ